MVKLLTIPGFLEISQLQGFPGFLEISQLQGFPGFFFVPKLSNSRTSKSYLGFTSQQ